MPREYKLYLNDILWAAGKIERYVHDIDRDRFLTGNLEADATLYNLMIIGEAVKNIPDAIRSKYPEVSWRSMAGLRDIAAHEYFRVNLEIVWSITQEDIPELKAQIMGVLKLESDETE